jgi:hypothetical protein
MGHASFHIHRDPGHGTWVVEEEDNREIGGIFATLLAALDFVDGESRRFQVAQAVIELSPREPAARRDAASARALPH